MDISSQSAQLETLPILDTAARRFTLPERRPMKRFVVFSASDKWLIAHHSHRTLRAAERKARSLRRRGITTGTVVVDQQDYTNELYSDDAMRVKDFQKLMEG
jgi:hypothetical protein